MPTRRLFPLILAGVFSIAMGLMAWLAASVWLERAAREDLRDEARRVATQQVRLFASDLAQFRLLPVVLGSIMIWARRCARAIPPRGAWTASCASWPSEPAHPSSI